LHNENQFQPYLYLFTFELRYLQRYKEIFHVLSWWRHKSKTDKNTLCTTYSQTCI